MLFYIAMLSASTLIKPDAYLNGWLLWGPLHKLMQLCYDHHCDSNIFSYNTDYHVLIKQLIF